MRPPQVAISDAAAKRLRNFDAWIYRDELAGPVAGILDGAQVELVDRRHAFVAFAFYSAQAHIAARTTSLRPDQPLDAALLRARFGAALARRNHLSATAGRRLVSSEADQLPGLIVDQYGRHLVLQLRTAGMDRWRPQVVAALQEALRPDGILERSDKEFRLEEGLAPVTQVLSGAVPDRLQIEEDRVRFWVDPYRGHKTGFYLDQRDARRRLRALIHPGQRVADVFAHTGAFGIGAAAAGARAVCVEQEEPLLALARDNAALNGVTDRVEWVAGDAFYWLEAKAGAGAQFDWVVLDPPGLAKTKAEVPKARRALHHLLAHTLRLLAPGGTLALFLCTYHLLGLAEEILRIAAADRGVRLRIIGTTLQAEDHPWILQAPATRYLMGWLARRDG